MASAEPPLAPEAEFKRSRTLWSQVQRTNHQQVMAKVNHRREATAVVPQVDTSYITNARAIFDDEDGWAGIAAAHLVKQALDALLKIPHDKEKNYDVVSHLLNVVSAEYLRVKHDSRIPGNAPALVYGSFHNHVVPEDYLAVGVKTDWQGTMDIYRTLQLAIQHKPIFGPWPGSVLDDVGEGKPEPPDAVDQFFWHLSATKGFRPDLSTVNGFQLADGKLQFTLLHSLGSVTAGPYDRDDAHAWIAHVVMVYHASETRDRRLQYAKAPLGEKHSGRWNVYPDARPGSTPPEPKFSVFPSYASHCPGRMTWTAFEPGEAYGQTHKRSPRDDFRTRLTEEPAVGFLKVSWQRPSVAEPPTTASNPRPETVGNDDPVAPAADQASACSTTTAKPDAVALLPGEDVSALTPSKASPLPKLPETEGELLRYAHKDGWLPGLVRYHDFPQRDEKIEFSVGDDKHVRFKEILHLASIGEPLSQCDSALEILEVAYDLTETHLQLLERKILHRDLSWFNILCKPWHHPATYDGKKKEIQGIPCINKIFGDENGKPVVLLIDLDHATHTDRIWKPGYTTGIERTGTPMFVARELSAVSEEELFDYPRGKRPLDALKADLQAAEQDAEIFARAFPGERSTTFMRNFEAVMKLEEKRLNSGEDTFSDPKELHRAHHDVQSIYWTLLWTFARALPRDSGASVIDGRLNTFCQLMLGHTVGEETPRQMYLNHHFRFDTILHPAFKHFACFFRSLTEYFMIPWHIYLKQGDVEPDHAHHAIRRLLLVEISYLRGKGKQFNIPLNKMQPRIYEPSELAVASVRKTLARNEFMPKFSAYFSAVTTGSKRKLGPDGPDGDAAECTEPKAKKAKVEAASDHPRSTAAMMDKFRDSRLLWFGTGRRE